MALHEVPPSKNSAIVLSLENDAKAKIVNASELFDLKPDHIAIPLDDKTATRFVKGMEYGRIRVIQGQKVMVRHLIFHVLSVRIS